MYCVIQRWVYPLFLLLHDSFYRCPVGSHMESHTLPSVPYLPPIGLLGQARPRSPHRLLGNHTHTAKGMTDPSIGHYQYLIASCNLLTLPQSHTTIIKSAVPGCWVWTGTVTTCMSDSNTLGASLYRQQTSFDGVACGGGLVKARSGAAWP